MARMMGSRAALGDQFLKSYCVDTEEGAGDLERGLRSIRGVRSVADEGSIACDVAEAVVRMDGADVGANNGDRGGDTSGRRIRRFIEYSVIWV